MVENIHIELEAGRSQQLSLGRLFRALSSLGILSSGVDLHRLCTDSAKVQQWQSAIIPPVSYGELRTSPYLLAVEQAHAMELLLKYGSIHVNTGRGTLIGLSCSECDITCIVPVGFDSTGYMISD